MKINPEEKKYIQENKSVYRFVKSRGWKICKDKLMKQIEDLQSVMNVDGKSAEEVFIDIKVRKLVVEELVGWLNSIENQATQFEGNIISPDETDESPYDIEEE